MKKNNLILYPQLDALNDKLSTNNDTSYWYPF